MIILKDYIERKARLLTKSPQTRKSLQRYFEDPDGIDEEGVYNQFKTVMLY
jgi:hypothetical protein